LCVCKILIFSNQSNCHYISINMTLLQRPKDILLVGLSIVIIFILCQGCDTEDDLSLVMKDGTKIKLQSEDVILYSDEEDFLNSYTFLFPCTYSFISNNNGPYLLNSSYSIEGYDDKFIGAWEKVKFNDWIIKYGLEPNKIYYCATVKYVIYLPVPLLNEEYIPIMPLTNMGYSPWSIKKSFDIVYKTHYPKYIFFTCLRYVGYNDHFEGIYKVLPLTNKLIWNFTVAQ
ncbi:MAG: hypothetical protein K2H01_07410, partial [Ruminococcus sp.]|nr:hypothetical protein [Ruminococcus sp.]